MVKPLVNLPVTPTQKIFASGVFSCILITYAINYYQKKKKKEIKKIVQ